MTDQFMLPFESLPFLQTANILWEPVWNLRVPLTPCERDLLDTWPLRRLGYVRTFGAGGLQMPTQHSRLSHVMGVFALVAHFRPKDEELRLAALLHDVGHGPFSHSSEILPGFDHHLAGREIVSASVVGDILRKHGFEPARIIALTEGEPPNPVRTQNGLLHLDHLDFFVRDPFACGWQSPLPVDLLSWLHLDGANVAAEMSVAEHIVERILFEHRLFTAPAKIAAEAVLKRLLILGAQQGILKTDNRSVVAMTDADLLARLARAEDPEIANLLDRLLRQPQTLLVRRIELDGTLPDSVLTIRFDQPYLSQPLVDGQPVSQRSARAASMLAEAQALMGTYLVEISA
jgi:HD superfamily phosphohydrolase